MTTQSATNPELSVANPLTSLVAYLKKHPLQSAITALVIVLLAYVAWGIFEWAVLKSVWNSTDGSLCREEGAGACWAVLQARWRLIVFGLYPFEEQWRSGLACVAIVITAVVSCIPAFWRFQRLSILWIAGFSIFTILMSGGLFGLSFIPVRQWGGLSLTLFVFATVCILTMPTSIALALLRDSKLYFISKPTQLIIDTVRSLPLLVVMFVSAVVLPFGLPDFMIGEKLFRVIAGFTFYVSCYQAEIIRGGIQSLPAGQDEAAKALGLTYAQRMGRIILPQAFKITLPATINQIVIIFLETPLIVIIGFFEVLASGAAAFGTAEWGIAAEEVYIFIGVIFFAFSLTLSRYGASLEARLARSDQR